MCDKRGTEKSKEKEQFMEYISKFRYKTNSVAGGFFSRQLAHHIRKFGKPHTFPLTHQVCVVDYQKVRMLAWAFGFILGVGESLR